MEPGLAAESQRHATVRGHADPEGRAGRGSVDRGSAGSPPEGVLN